MTAGEGAAGAGTTLWDEAWLDAVTDVEVVAGRKTGDGTEIGLGAGADALVGHVVGSGAGTEPEAGADEAEVTAGAAVGF